MLCFTHSCCHSNLLDPLDIEFASELAGECGLSIAISRYLEGFHLILTILGLLAVRQLSAVGKNMVPPLLGASQSSPSKRPTGHIPNGNFCSKKLHKPRTKRKRNLNDTDIFVCPAVLVNMPGSLEPRLKACNPAELETRLLGMLVGEGTAAALYVQKGGAKIQC